MTYFLKTIGFKKINKLFFLIVALVLVLLFFHTRGIFYADDGYILSGAKRIYDGQIPYKDFHFVYTPLSIYLDALSFKLFGVSILAARIMAAIISFVTVIIILKIVKQFTSKKYLHYGAILLFLAWGPTHSNFIFPTQIAISTALLTCLLLLLGRKNKNYWLFFFAAITTLLTFLSKQNFGIALLPAIFLFFIFSPSKKIKQIKWYSYGLVVSLFIFFLLLFFSGSLPGFIQDFYIFGIQHVLVGGALNTGFITEFSVYGIVKSLLYLSPFLLSIIAGWICFRKNKKLLFLPVFTACFYLLGIRPTTDYIHLTPFLSISCLPFLFIVQEVKKPLLKFSLYSFLIIFILVGFQTALWKNYYRWLPPLISNNYFDFHPRVQIFLPDNALSHLTNAITSQTKPGDSIFITFYSPLLYFTSDRYNPTKFELFEEFPFYKQYKEEITQDLERTKTPLIITPDNPPQGFLRNYVLKKYKKISYQDGVYFWKRR